MPSVVTIEGTGRTALVLRRPVLNHKGTVLPGFRTVVTLEATTPQRVVQLGKQLNRAGANAATIPANYFDAGVVNSETFR